MSRLAVARHRRVDGRAPARPVLAFLLLAGLALASAPAHARRLGSIEFHRCELSAPHSAQVLDAECGSFDVAENPDAPSGRQIRLKLALLPARAAKPQRDLIVYLAGGPGQSAVDSFPIYANGFQQMLKDRSVLLVDQRGTGQSNPLKCPHEAADHDAEPTPQNARAQALRCLAALRDHADPRFYTTSDAIRDLEALRHALGDPLYNLVGASYGTRVALTYLQQHAASLRSLVLDGVVPQDSPLGQEHAQNLEEGLAKIFAACRADTACAKRFGDPAATLAALRARLRQKPLTVTLDDPLTHLPLSETLGERELAGIVRLFAYQPEAAALLPLLIDEAEHGRPQALVAQGLLAFGDVQDSLAQGMGLSVICAEDAPALKERPEDEATLIGNRLVQAYQAQCAVWPAGRAPEGFRQPVASAIPVLLLSGEWDPVTPPRYAESVAKSLSNSRALVARGRGHTVLWRGCVPKLAAQFVETLKPAALDTACMDAFGATPAFISYQGPAP